MEKGRYNCAGSREIDMQRKEEPEELWRAEGRMMGAVVAGQYLGVTQPRAHFPLPAGQGENRRKSKRLR